MKLNTSSKERCQTPKKEPEKSVALFAATHHHQALEQVARFAEEMHREGFTLHIEESLAYALSQSQPLPYEAHTFHHVAPAHVLLAVCFGGDGTFLRTLHRLADTETPLLAVNSGNLGFLTNINVSDVLNYVPQLVRGDYAVETRPLLEVRVNGSAVAYAFNEVAIQKRETGSMIHISTYIDDSFLACYSGDGLIIATPSGSTAYSLSLHGPIVTPACPVVLLTPIAPHSLNMRPLVVTDDKLVSLTVAARSSSFVLAVDGQLFVFPIDSKIEVCKAQRMAHLVTLEQRPFADILREKLLWGEQRREA